ncbi:uncharacterized protein NPIL_314071 [Nephila pilipes]|uniref:Uncharacterized protein n=1 Tax=Nephila pilipes TaxID=299642 RepID=A0A8X6TUX9_NEPPI|nr:uncharacterized protein NPIL_314071 [Nephila pilipes]
MCALKETPKDQLSGIRLTLSKLTALRARSIYLRKLSQENHVKRMILARKINHLSPAFILPSKKPYSPIREAKPKPSGVHLTLKSPNNAIKKPRNIIEKDKCVDKIPMKNQRTEALFKNDVKDTVKYSKTKNNKNIPILPTSEELINNSKPVMSFATFLKIESPGRNACIIDSNQSFLEQFNSNKTQIKKDLKRRTFFPKKSPSRKPGENNSNAQDSKKFSTPSKLIPLRLRKATKSLAEFKNTSIAKPEALETGASGYFRNTCLFGTKKKHDKKEQNHNETGEVPKQIINVTSKHVSKTLSGTELFPKGKNKTIKNSDPGDQIHSKTEINIAVKTNCPNNFSPMKIKKNVSISESFSADSLEVLKKDSKQSDSLMSSAVSKIQDNMEQKTNDFLESNIPADNLDKKVVVKASPDKAKKQHFFKLSNQSNISKIPIPECNVTNIKSQQKVTETPKTSFFGDDNAKNEVLLFNNHQKGDWAAIPLKSKNSAVSSWLKTVQEPKSMENKECNEERVAELNENSTSLIKSSAANNNFAKEDRKSFFTSPESNNCSNTSKTISETETFKTTINNTSESFSLALTEPEIEGRNSSEKKSEFQKNIKAYTLARNSRDFLVHPIEKFMKEINAALNNSDSEELNTESSLAPKVKKVVKGEKRPIQVSRAAMTPVPSVTAKGTHYGVRDCKDV